MSQTIWIALATTSIVPDRFPHMTLYAAMLRLGGGFGDRVWAVTGPLDNHSSDTQWATPMTRQPTCAEDWL